MIVAHLRQRESRGRLYWEARWTDDDGRRRSRCGGLVSGVHNRRWAEAWCAEITTKLNNGGGLEPARRLTLSAWCDRYLELRTDLGARTHALHAKTCEYLKNGLGVGARLSRITPHDADRWKAYLEAKGLSEQTVCSHIRTAKVVFAWARRRGEVHGDPFGCLRGVPRRGESRWTVLTADEVLRLLDVAPGPAWRCMLGLCALAGLRLEEARRASWDDVDWERRRLRVWARDGVVTTKQRARSVYLSPILERILLDARDVGLIVGDLGTADLHRAMVGTDRRPGIVARAGISPYPKPFHTLRKWRSSTWCAIFPLPFVSEWIGDRPETLMRHYVQMPGEGCVIQEEREIARKMGYGAPVLSSA